MILNDREALKKNIKRALNRKLTSQEFITSYNLIYAHCTQKTKKFEILGEKIYNLLYNEIDMFIKGLVYSSVDDFISIITRYETAVESICGFCKYLSRFYIRCNIDLRMSNVFPLKKLLYSLFYNNFLLSIENIILCSLNSTIIKFYYKLLLYSDQLKKFEEVKVIYADNIELGDSAEEVVRNFVMYLKEIGSIFTGKSREDVITKMKEKVENVEDVLEFLCTRIGKNEEIPLEIVESLNIYREFVRKLITHVFDKDSFETIHVKGLSKELLVIKDLAELTDDGKNIFNFECESCLALGKTGKGNKLPCLDLESKVMAGDTKQENLNLIFKFFYCCYLNNRYFHNENFEVILREIFLSRIEDRNELHKDVVKGFDLIIRKADRTNENVCKYCENAIYVCTRTPALFPGSGDSGKVSAYDQRTAEYSEGKLSIFMKLLEIFSEDFYETIHHNILKRILLNETNIERERLLVSYMEQKIKYFGKSRLALTNFLSDLPSKIENLKDGHGECSYKDALNSPMALNVPGEMVRCFPKYFWPFENTEHVLNDRLQDKILKISSFCNMKGYRVEFNHYLSKVALKINERRITCDAVTASLILNIYDDKKIENSNEEILQKLIERRVILKENNDEYKINEDLEDDVNLFEPKFVLTYEKKRTPAQNCDKSFEVLKSKIMKIMKRSKTKNVHELGELLDGNIDGVLIWLLKNNYLKRKCELIEYVP